MFKTFNTCDGAQASKYTMSGMREEDKESRTVGGRRRTQKTGGGKQSLTVEPRGSTLRN